ncbi:MAG: hypothetical protein GVY34_09200 [Alphaproteobacteria bacterium]|jgi:hypothetical protein|nr:hypothetical protein [Alphaproteobacteria bacterium]
MILRQPGLSWIAGLLGIVACQAMIVALAQHCGLGAARMVQPVTAMALPALVWLAWKADGMGAQLGAQDALHLLGPGLAVALQSTGAPLLDVLVPLGHAGYALAIARALRPIGPDLPRRTRMTAPCSLALKRRCKCAARGATLT